MLVPRGGVPPSSHLASSTTVNVRQFRLSARVRSIASGRERQSHLEPPFSYDAQVKANWLGQ